MAPVIVKVVPYQDGLWPMRFIAGYRWCPHQGYESHYADDIMVGIVGKGKGKKKRKQKTECRRRKSPAEKARENIRG